MKAPFHSSIPKLAFKTFILGAAILGTTFLSNAQDTTTQLELRPYTKLDLSLQGIGATFERRLSSKATIDLSAGFGGGYDVYGNNIEYVWDLLDPALYFSVTPKLFYNREKRLAKGKSMAYNAGNYVGLRLKYTTRNLGESNRVWDAILINAHWGLQRPLGRRWSINTHAGIGYAADATDLQNSSGTVYPALDFKFSYNFRQKDK